MHHDPTSVKRTARLVWDWIREINFSAAFRAGSEWCLIRISFVFPLFTRFLDNAIHALLSLKIWEGYCNPKPMSLSNWRSQRACLAAFAEAMYSTQLQLWINQLYHRPKHQRPLQRWQLFQFFNHDRHWRLPRAASELQFEYLAKTRPFNYATLRNYTVLQLCRWMWYCSYHSVHYFYR